MTLITQLFLVPVSARNIWHNDPLFVYKIQTKRKCIADYESILLLTQARLIGFILQWLINYSFLSSYSKNLEAFSTERNEAYKMPSKIKKTRQEKQKKRGGEKATCKSKSQDCCVPFKSRKFCFLCMRKLCKLIFSVWIRKPWSVQPVNGFMGSFSSL